MSEKPISIREFARRMGCSDTAVHKAIDSLKIQNAIVYKDNGKVKGLIESIAREEWQSRVNTSYTANPTLLETLVQENVPRGTHEHPPAPVKHESNVPRGTQQESVPRGTSDIEKDIEQTGRPLNALEQQMKWKNAKLQAEALNKSLEFKIRSGEYVRKDIVEKELFEAGQQIRTSLQSLPDRIAEEILGRPAAEVRKILHDEIHKTLEALTDVSRKDFQTR